MASIPQCLASGKRLSVNLVCIALAMRTTKGQHGSVGYHSVRMGYVLKTLAYGETLRGGAEPVFSTIASLPSLSGRPIRV